MPKEEQLTRTLYTINQLLRDLQELKAGVEEVLQATEEERPTEEERMEITAVPIGFVQPMLVETQQVAKPSRQPKEKEIQVIARFKRYARALDLQVDLQSPLLLSRTSAAVSLVNRVSVLVASLVSTDEEEAGE